MRRPWLVIVVVAYLATLAAVIQAQPAPLPAVLSDEARTRLREVYTQSMPAAVAVETTPEGIGSGFFVSPDGLVLTAFHVIRDARSFSVVTSDQKTYPATVVGYDELRDIALIQARVDQRVPYLELETRQGVRVGDPILNIGNSRGQFISARPGLVTAIDRNLRADFPAGLISSTMPLAPGDSGGPVINSSGKVVAIAVAIGNVEGVFQSYVAPLVGLADFIGQLQAGYKRDAPYIGLSFQAPITPNDIGLGNRGVVVQRVAPSSSAAKAGLRNLIVRENQGQLVVQQADIILKVNNIEVNSFEELVGVVRKYKVGDVVVLRVLRDGNITDLKVELIPRPKDL